jgi:hypothetical protein
MNASRTAIWRVRFLLLVAVAVGIALHAHGAVLPLSYDAFSELGARAGVTVQPMAAVAGRWIGRTESGQPVSLVLQVDGDAVAGAATLEGVVPNAEAGPRALVTPTMHGRTMAFAVRPGPCAKALTHGVVTFVSSGSAQLDLLGGRAPISIRLQKVG